METMTLANTVKIPLLLPLNLQFFAESEDELKAAISKAVNALQEDAVRRAEEVKAFGEARAETNERIDRLNSVIEEMKKQLDESAAKNNRIHAPQTKAGEETQLERKNAFIKYVKEGKLSLTAEEKKLLDEINVEVKALVENTNGEIIVPEDLDRTIYTNKTEDVVLRQLAFVQKTSRNRVRRIGMNNVTAGFGKLETSSTQSLVNFESDLEPSEAFIFVENLYGMTKIGEDELMDSAVDLAEFLAQSYREAFKLVESAGFLRGRGHEYEEPEGILTAAKVPTLTTAAAGTLTPDDLINLMYTVPSSFHRKHGVYLVNTEVERQMRLFRDGNGSFIFSQSLQAGVPSTFNGRPVHVEDSFETFASGTKQAVYGDIKAGYQIVENKGLSIIRLNEKYIEHDLIAFRAKSRVGGGVVRPTALATLTIQ